MPLIYFLVLFPVLVLGVFGWLVSKHSGKLFAPGDFKNEDNYVKMQLSAVASLTAASAKNHLGTSEISEFEIQRIVEVVLNARSPENRQHNALQPRILWVDDNPDNNVYERQAFEAVGLSLTLAMSTNEALVEISHQQFAAIISDMGRREGPREGYVLLDGLRKRGDTTPFFIYAASNAPEHKRETLEHGGQGCTNNGQELFGMVTNVVLGDSGTPRPQRFDR